MKGERETKKEKIKSKEKHKSRDGTSGPVKREL